MTTPAAAARYLAEHQALYNGRPTAVYNPHMREVNSLPVIYGFNNGGTPGFYQAVLLAEDGTCLGGHLCSEEGYMPHDLGILAGTRPDRHKTFREHYPDGYRMVFIPASEVLSHQGLDEAYKKNQEAKALAKE